MLPANQKDLLISSPNQGIPVSFAPKLIEDAINLKRAAREYYYPMMAIKHLRALSSGLTGKNNVFIPNIKDFKTNAFQRVVVYVPGIKATVERRHDGSLVITEFTMSDGYEALAKRSRERPGVYRVRSVSTSEASVQYKNNGRIVPENGRNVVIADASYSSPKEAAIEVINSIKSTRSRHIAETGDFDMFYSAVGKKLGGMTSYTPEIHKVSYASAGLLADAMERSKEQTSVTWVSEQSGSVVLTQALQTLALKNVSFKDKRHRVCMHSPTTSPMPTLQAVGELNMVADSGLATGDGHVRAAFGSLLSNARRANNRDDHYTWGDYYNDLSGGVMAGLAVAGATSFVASAAVGSPILAGVGTFCSAAGAIQLACKPVKTCLKKVKLK
ncbi:hypothetical protein QFX18_18970 [Saccharophagus degradans]|uniref:hypothetical protein n=1 Tax=Saccharophagus degradans TaxID=86304 RepID=UPI00247801A4|nr:hypothetical protein [Saccharophagus degradans]WGO98091.1 hypothetical protein QFX18_18970 [Saccharophagus degradans]